MRYRSQPYRGDEYRRACPGVRSKAEMATDHVNRVALLQIVKAWERMARWEDENNQPSDT